MGYITVCPECSRQIVIPLSTELCSILPQHGVQGSIELFHHPIALWAVGGGVQHLDTEEFAHVSHYDKRFVPRSERRDSVTPNWAMISETNSFVIGRPLAILSGSLGTRGHNDFPVPLWVVP